MPEVGNDEITHYADDPLGYMNERDVSREERAKQWIVALASSGQLDPKKLSKKELKKLEDRKAEQKEEERDGDEEEPWEPWIDPPKPYKEPFTAAYIAKKNFLNLWSTRRWDYTFLLLLGLNLLLIPINHSDLVAGIRGTLGTYIGLIFLLMWVMSVVPVVFAIFTRKTMWSFIKSRGSEERKRWSIMYIMGLRATAHNPDTWWRETPALRHYIRCICPQVIRLLPCSERWEQRRLTATLPCQALSKVLYVLLCKPCNMSAPVGVGPEVDLSAPEEARIAWEKKKKEEAEAPRQYWDSETGVIHFLTPHEKEERDERLRIEAEQRAAREEAERIAREEAERARIEAEEAAAKAEADRLERRRLRREAGESSSSEEESSEEEEEDMHAEEEGAEEKPSVLSDPSQGGEPGPAGSEGGEGEMGDVPEGDSVEGGDSLEGGESLDTGNMTGGLSKSPFAIKSTKAMRKPKPMPHDQRNAMANQSSRDPLELGWERPGQPKSMDSVDENVAWRCRVCGRDNNVPLVLTTKAEVDMEIIKKPIPGTSEMTYKVNLAPKEAKQKCRVCGTYYDYRPPGCYVENYFVQEGDNDLDVYRKHKRYAKEQARLAAIEAGEDGDDDDADDDDQLDPSKRKKKEKVVVLGDKKPITQYLASKDEIFAEIEASKEPGYNGYSVKLSRPPRLAGDHEFKDDDIDADELAMLEAAEKKEDEDAAHKAALERARREQEGSGRKGIWIILDLINWDEKFQPKIDAFNAKKEEYRTRYRQKMADLRIKRAEYHEKFMNSKPTQLAIKTYKTMKFVYKVAEDAAYASRKKAEMNSDMVFNDYRFKRRALEFRPPFPRHRSPNLEENEFFPLHANIESIAHNPSWFPGIITRVHMNNTYDIRFDNGEDVQCVEATLIRFRLRVKVSVLMQMYAIAFIFFVWSMSFELGAWYSFDYKYKVHARNRWCTGGDDFMNDDVYGVDDFKKFEGEPKSARYHHDSPRNGRLCMNDSRIGLLVAPVFAISFVMTFGHGLQLVNSYLMRTHAAGCCIHTKFWLLFAIPGLFLSLLCYMVWGRLSDGGSDGGSMMTMTVAPVLFFSMSLAGQAYFMQPLYSHFLFYTGWAFSLFVIGIAMDIDFPLLWPSIFPMLPMAVPFLPAWALWFMIWRYLPYIDYIWDAATGMTQDVEPELAAERMAWLRSGTN